MRGLIYHVSPFRILTSVFPPTTGLLTVLSLALSHVLFYIRSVQSAMMLSRTSTSSSSSDHSKRSLLSCLPTDCKVLATATARVYHLPFNARSDNWTYSGLAGALVFARSRTTVHADRKLGAGTGTTFDQTYSFRLIDPVKGLVWMHEIPSSFDYALDKPFFHVFSGKVRDATYVSLNLCSVCHRAGCLASVSTTMTRRQGC